MSRQVEADVRSHRVYQAIFEIEGYEWPLNGHFHHSGALARQRLEELDLLAKALLEVDDQLSSSSQPEPVLTLETGQIRFKRGTEMGAYPALAARLLITSAASGLMIGSSSCQTSGGAAKPNRVYLPIEKAKRIQHNPMGRPLERQPGPPHVADDHYDQARGLTLHDLDQLGWGTIYLSQAEHQLGNRGADIHIGKTAVEVCLEELEATASPAMLKTVEEVSRVYQLLS